MLFSKKLNVTINQALLINYSDSSAGPAGIGETGLEMIPLFDYVGD